MFVHIPQITSHNNVVHDSLNSYPINRLLLDCRRQPRILESLADLQKHHEPRFVIGVLQSEALLTPLSETLKHTLQVVDISDGFESDSDGEVPNTKRTPRGRSKRQRMTYDEDDSPDLDPDDTQVLSYYVLTIPCMTTTDHQRGRHTCLPANTQLLC